MDNKKITDEERLLIEFVEVEHMIFRLEKMIEKRYPDVHTGKKEEFKSREEELGYDMMLAMKACYNDRKWELFFKIKSIGPYHKELYHMDHYFQVVLTGDYGYVPVNCNNAKEYDEETSWPPMPYQSFDRMVHEFIEDGIVSRMAFERKLAEMEAEVNRLVNRDKNEDIKRKRFKVVK